MVQLSKFSIYTLVIALGACEFSTEKKSDPAPQQRSSEDVKADEKKVEAAKQEELRAESMALSNLLEEFKSASPDKRRALLEKLSAFDLSKFSAEDFPSAKALSQYFVKGGASKLVDKLQALMAQDDTGLGDFLGAIIGAANEVLAQFSKVPTDVWDSKNPVFGVCGKGISESDSNTCESLKKAKADFIAACEAAGGRYTKTSCSNTDPNSCPDDGKRTTTPCMNGNVPSSEPIEWMTCSKEEKDVCPKMEALENKEPAAPN